MRRPITFGLLLFIFSAVGLVALQFVERNQRGDRVPDIFIPPPNFIRHLTFGYNDSAADSLWLRVIQDMDVCGKKSMSRKEFDEKLADLGDRTQREVVQNRYIQEESKIIDNRIFDSPDTHVCTKGWTFRLLDAVTELAPRFRMPYAVGAPALSVLVNDHEGANVIYEKAIRRFPKDWKILYRAAYHYLYEMHDLSKAADLLNRAGELGAPPWVKSLAARLYTRTGQIYLGLVILEDYYKTIESGPYKKKVAERIKNLKKALATLPPENQ